MRPVAGWERTREVAELAVDLDGQRRPRQPGADRGGRVGARRACGQASGCCRQAAGRPSPPDPIRARIRLLANVRPSAGAALRRPSDRRTHGRRAPAAGARASATEHRAQMPPAAPRSADWGDSRRRCSDAESRPDPGSVPAACPRRCGRVRGTGTDRRAPSRRWISASTAAGSGVVQRMKVATIVSKLASGNGQALGTGLAQLHRRRPGRRVGDLLPEQFDHVGARLGDHQLAHPFGEVRKVDAAARTELQRAPARRRDELAAGLALAGVLGQREQARVIQREETLVEAPRVAHPPTVSRRSRRTRRPLHLAASRAISSAGRAPPRQGGGHWFEPSIAHSGSCSGFAYFRSSTVGVRQSPAASSREASDAFSHSLREPPAKQAFVAQTSWQQRVRLGKVCCTN